VCGIAGLIGPGASRRRVDAMVTAQHHRGPDDSGTFVDATHGIALGANRLSIIDLSAAGHQPMVNHDGTAWLVYNGEVYNYRELRAELADSYPFRTRSDSEVVLAAYHRWGEACVERFIGMFAFAIWDAARRKVVCARDRLGIKPFHYAWQDGTFLFASEIRALLAAGIEARPDRRTWAAYLVHGYSDHTPQTFFDGITTLEPGQLLALQDGRATTRSYWDLPARAQPPMHLSDDEAAGRLLELLDDSVRLRLRSDVPVGVNLSGGLDSASLMVTVDQLMPGAGEIQTFTASFPDTRYDEQEFADQVPRTRPWARNIQRLPPDQVWAIAAEAMRHQEAPYGGVGTLAYHHLHRLALDRGVTVLLEAQGVDEMLAGYAYFRPAFQLDLVEQGRRDELERELAADGSAPVPSLEGLRERLSAAAASPVVYQDGTRHLRPECIHPEVRALAGDPPVFPRPFSDHLTNALYRDLRYTKLPRVLRMNDRFSMAFSRELREPFLDHRIVEFLFRLPGHQKIRLGQGKFLLRHAMAGRLPDAVRLAPKRAVVTPQREWLRGALRPGVLELIESESFADRGLFDAAEVRKAYGDFCRGAADNAFFVWQWINAEHWFRAFCDQTARVPAPP
jgi:asparagine synthase (glutamine-hydrolysing)